MRSVWDSLQSARWWLRWPVKLTAFLCVLVLVLYPRPSMLLRHIHHIRMAESLPDPSSPALQPVLGRFEAYLAARSIRTSGPELLVVVNEFVRQQVRYSWDWDRWGCVDYLPSLEEVLASGLEDCDGRAVLAAAILRARGVPADLVGDLRHIWVRTPFGETMNPTGPPAFARGPARELRVDWAKLIDPAPMAFGISVFPLERELIILLAAWLLLLPRQVNGFRAALILLLLVAGLMLIRLAGADPDAVRYGPLAWAAVHLAAAAAIVAGIGQSTRSAGLPMRGPERAAPSQRPCRLPSPRPAETHHRP